MRVRRSKPRARSRKLEDCAGSQEPDDDHGDDDVDNDHVDAFYLVDIFYQERMRIISSGAENIRNVFRSTREYVLR